jgi:hypothetical protein
MCLEERSKLHLAARETTRGFLVPVKRTSEAHPGLWTTVLQANGAPDKDV